MKVSAKYDNSGLLHLVRTLPDDTDDMNRELADLTLDLATEKVPVATGELRDSGHIESLPNGYAVVYDAHHAAYVHFGTSRMAPRPWLAEAAAGVQGYRQRLLANLTAKVGKGQ